jgi:hypothetical protein
VQNWLNTNNGFIVPIVQGKFITPDIQQVTGADTFDGLDEILREDNGITSTFQKIDNNILKMFQQNSLNNTRMQLFIVDSEGQWHGGIKGFTISFYIKNFSHDGYGANPKIEMNFKWQKKLTVFNDISEPDENYFELTNYISDGIYTELGSANYIAGQVTGYNGITGWVKSVYPILYARNSNDVLFFYGSSADRSSQTNALASCDSRYSLSIIEENSSGFGGALTFVSNAIVNATTWSITFSL